MIASTVQVYETGIPDRIRYILSWSTNRSDYDEMLGAITSKAGNLALRVMLTKKRQNPIIQCRSDDPQVLLMLVPGAMLYPEDYVSLREALMDHPAGSSICLVTCAPDWAKIDVAHFITSAANIVNESIEQAMKAVKISEYSRSTGMLEQDQFGRYQRLLIVMHSLSGMVSAGSFPMHKSSAIVLLASSLSQAVSGICPALRSFPLPVLSIFGDFDGQQHVCKVAIDLCNSGVLFSECSDTVGACYFAMISKCNHASFSNGKRNALRGDLPLDGIEGSSIYAVSIQVAELILSKFLYAARLIGDPDSPSTLGRVAFLREQTQASISLLKGYLRELGRIPRHESTSSVSKEMTKILRYACGNEMVHADKLGNGITMYHPGQLARADEFAVCAQRFILKNTRNHDQRSIFVTANVHTSEENFKYSRVAQWETPTSLHIEVQCFANVPIKGTEYTIVSPCYALKLLCAKDIHGKGLDDVETIAKGIFDIAWHHAERSSPQVLHKRYLEYGHSLAVTFAFHCIPQRWVSSKSILKRNGILKLQGYTTNSAATNQSSVRMDDSFDQPGLLCIHIPSVAWCMEYMFVHGLKSP